MIYYKPTDLDLYKVLPFPHKSIEKDYYKYLYVISNVFIQRYDRHYYFTESHIELNFANLTSVLRKDTTKILQNLIKFKIIFCDEIYIKGEKNFGYKLNPIYTRTHSIHVNFDDKISVRADKFHSQTFNETEIRLKQDLNKLKYIHTIDRNIDDLEEQERFYKQANIFHLDSFNNSEEVEMRFYKDDYGRIHTPLTNLMRGLKAGLSFNGKDLHEIDCSHSQPRFIALEAAKTHGMKHDIITFLHLCEGTKEAKDGLYDYLMIEIGFNGSRDNFKKFLLQNVYGKFFYNPELAEVFMTQFPTIYEFIMNQKDGNHKLFSQKMQKVESDLVIQTVCKNLYEKYDDISLCTIHDSIICNEEYVDVVRFEMELAFDEIFNYKIFCDSSQLSENFTYICEEVNDMLIEEEIWKDIIGYEGLYQVSNFGRVKSLSRKVGDINNKIGYIIDEKILTNNLCGNYYRVNLHKNNDKGKKHMVHQLVAVHFLGHIICGMKKVIDHRDRNPLNNRVENLEIKSQKENCQNRKNWKGYSYHKRDNRWITKIDDKYFRFKTEQEAIEAVKKYKTN